MTPRPLRVVKWRVTAVRRAVVSPALGGWIAELETRASVVCNGQRIPCDADGGLSRSACCACSRLKRQAAKSSFSIDMTTKRRGMQFARGFGTLTSGLLVT